MRFISTKVHGMMDYVGGALLIAAPLLWLNAANEVPAAFWTPFLVGVVVLVQSLFTDYEYSLSNSIPMPAHLGMDVFFGLLLAVSPWLFNFQEVVWVPHLIVGLLLIGSGLMTKLRRQIPATRSTTNARPVRSARVKG
jgi:hypothetical protein